MIYMLMAAGIFALIFGWLLLVSPAIIGKVGEICNRVVFSLDEWFKRNRILVGVALLAVAGWLLLVAGKYSAWYLDVTWGVAMAFGILFLFFPGWLSWISKASDRVLVSTDELVFGSRRALGILLIVVGLYIFYSVFLMRK
jgi:hypothetical protein